MLKLFRETWKRVREELKAEIKLKKEIKELARLPLNYELIQNIINAAAKEINPVEVEINGPDYKMTIKPVATGLDGFKTFRERYDDAHK